LLATSDHVSATLRVMNPGTNPGTIWQRIRDTDAAATASECAMPLSDANCRAAKCPPDKKRVRLNDGGGLYLEVTPNGKRRWFWRFYPDGKEDRLALGSYPEIGLRAARDARDEHRRAYKRGRGQHPRHARKIERASARARRADTFEAVARECYEAKRSGWSETHAVKWMRLLERDLFPWVGALPLAEITAGVLREPILRVQARGAVDSAHAVRRYAGQVFKFGIALDLCKKNPAADLTDTLKPLVVRNVGAIIKPHAAGELMRKIRDYSGHPVTRAALALSAYVFQRPGNIRAMEWSEVDADAAMWTIPAEKMKRKLEGKINGRPHLVPLAPQALVILADLRTLTGHERFVFPAAHGSGCMSENTIRAALRRMGYANDEMTAHGFRAMARTIIEDHMGGIGADVVEAQLAHIKAGPLGAAYDRAEYLAQRRELMAKWADYLDRLRDGAEVIQITGRAA